MVVLVARELCLFLAVDASAVPAKQRSDFVALAVRRAAPFDDPAYDVSWSATGTASVWYWSQRKLRALLPEDIEGRCRFTAEALFVSAPDAGNADRIELLQLTDGYDVRAWQNGAITASRWWPQLPDADQWSKFHRSIGIKHNVVADAPEPLTAERLSKPWNKSAYSNRAASLSALDRYFKKTAFAASLLALASIGLVSGMMARAYVDEQRAKKSAANVDAGLQRILSAREHADELNADIENLISLRGARSTTSLMADLSRALGPGKYQLKQWKQPTPDTLEITLSSLQLSPEQVISALESGSIFSNVASDLSASNDLVVKATIGPDRDLAAGAEI